MRPTPEGQRRRDRAYQEVLAWTEGTADGPVGVSRGPGAPEASLRPDGTLRILPQHRDGGADGFYVARLRLSA